MKSTLYKQTGVMLLEGLIAVLVFSVGILAMVGLQAAAIKNSSDATYRSEASYMANQILAQMWADQANLASYKLNDTDANACVAGANTSNYAGVQGWLANDIGRLPGTANLHQRIVIAASNVVTVTLCWKGPQEIGFHNFVASAQIN